MPWVCNVKTQARTHIHTNPRQHNPISAQINEGHIEMSWLMRQLTLPLTFTPLLLINKSFRRTKKNNEEILPLHQQSKIEAKSDSELRKGWRIQFGERQGLAAELREGRMPGDSDELKTGGKRSGGIRLARSTITCPSHMWRADWVWRGLSLTRD